MCVWRGGGYQEENIYLCIRLLKKYSSENILVKTNIQAHVIFSVKMSDFAAVAGII